MKTTRRGNVEWWYDPSAGVRSWVVRTVDKDGNQVGGADYVGDKTGRNLCIMARSKLPTFADHLREARADLGITQEQAAGRFRWLSVRTLQAWESGQQAPPAWAQALVLEKLDQRPQRRPRAAAGYSDIKSDGGLDPRTGYEAAKKAKRAR